jgi:hypothetical protein
VNSAFFLLFSFVRWRRLSPLSMSATNYPILPSPDDRWLWHILLNENWHGKPKYLEEVSVPLHSPHIPHELTRDWTQRLSYGRACCGNKRERLTLLYYDICSIPFLSLFSRRRRQQVLPEHGTYLPHYTVWHPRRLQLLYSPTWKSKTSCSVLLYSVLFVYVHSYLCMWGTERWGAKLLQD